MALELNTVQLKLRLDRDGCTQAIPIFRTVNNIIDNVSAKELKYDTFLEDVFNTMWLLTELLKGKDFDYTNRMILYNRVIRMKGYKESVELFFRRLGMDVKITRITIDEDNGRRLCDIYSVIDFDNTPLIEVVEFQRLYKKLCNELIFFGRHDYVIQNVYMQFKAHSVGVITYINNFTNNITIGDNFL